MWEEAGPEGRGVGEGLERTAGEAMGGGLQNLGSQAVSRPKRPFLLGPQCRWSQRGDQSGSVTLTSQKPSRPHVFDLRNIWPQSCHQLSRYFAQKGDFLY